MGFGAKSNCWVDDLINVDYRNITQHGFQLYASKAVTPKVSVLESKSISQLLRGNAKISSMTEEPSGILLGRTSDLRYLGTSLQVQ